MDDPIALLLGEGELLGTTVLKAGRPELSALELEGDRLTSMLDYGSGVEDVFSWQVFTPEELVAVARPTGLSPVLVCAAFDEAFPAAYEQARMQLVFARG